MSVGAAAHGHPLGAGRACPALSKANSLPARSGGGHLRGDIDGDGKRDDVSIRYDPASRASCGFVLVVETAKRVLAVRVSGWYKPTQDLAVRSWPWPDPYLASIVQLAPRREQIVVSRSHGASNAVVSLYGLVGGGLVALRFDPRRYQNELSLFGSVGTGTTDVRCARRGSLIELSQGPANASGKRRTRWISWRSVYRLAGGSSRLVGAHKVVSTPTGADEIARRWGFAALPFTGCTVSRGTRL
jgi:hypothetical protein